MSALLAAVFVFVVVAPDPLAAPPRGRDARRRSGAALVPVRTRAWLSLRAGRAGPSDPSDIVPQALDLLARSLRAGASLRTAIDTVVAELPESELAGVADRVRGGASLTRALDGWATGSAERQTAATLLVLGHRSGAAMAASLDRAAAALRQRRYLTDEIRALTAQTRTSGVVVAAAPAAFAVVVAMVDTGAFAMLITTPVGLASTVLGLTLEALGVWWMRRLSHGVARGA